MHRNSRSGLAKTPCRFVWYGVRQRGGGWFIDLFDNEGLDLITGIPLRSGRNILEEHAHLGLGALTVSLDGETSRDPAYDEMGSKVQLYWMAS